METWDLITEVVFDENDHLQIRQNKQDQQTKAVTNVFVVRKEPIVNRSVIAVGRKPFSYIFFSFIW